MYKNLLEKLYIRRVIMRALKEIHHNDILDIIRKGGNVDETYDAVKEALKKQKEILKFFRQYFRGWYN